jgi:phosphoribosylaminoimidazole carboxylase
MKFYTIGILGGGQLGRMLAFAARRMGMSVAVLDPDPEAPGGQVANQHVVGSFRDPALIRELASGCDVVTVEIEHVDTAALEALEAEGIPIQPSAATIRLIQDKYAQKVHFAAHGIPVAPFREVQDEAAARAAIMEFGLPLMLKSKRMAYDGRGNYVLQNPDDLPQAFAALGETELYAEAWIPFTKELAVMVARGLDGTLVDYPVVETIQRDNICHTVIAPGQISPASAVDAREIARQAVASLRGAGIYGVELFLLPDGQVILNEIAPRPHNSGHYTIEACVTSQFEQHLRAITGLSLGDPSLKVGAAAMINVLGGETFDDTRHALESALSLPNAAVHWYGKRVSRPGRKMGHITLIAPTAADLLPQVAALTDAAANVKPIPQVGIIMGSDSDLPVMRAAARVLKEFGIPFELTIVSAHRTPDRMVEYAREAHGRGLRAIIAGAGGAAHLPGMIAALTPLPVIGVPIRIEPLDGQDALYSIVQMPRGVPVATVAIGNATNAGLLAVRILAASDPGLYQKMLDYQETMRESVMRKVESLSVKGWEDESG